MYTLVCKGSSYALEVVGRNRIFFCKLAIPYVFEPSIISLFSILFVNSSLKSNFIGLSL